MAKKIFCDRCTKEVTSATAQEVTPPTMPGVPASLPTKDLCASCYQAYCALGEQVAKFFQQ